MQNTRQASQIHQNFSARAMRQIALDSDDILNPKERNLLTKLGIHFPEQHAGKILKAARESGFAMDAIQPTITTGSITTPIQFLQNFLPGFVHVITDVRNIDEFVGMSVVGSWEFEQIVQGIMELTGTSVPYGDYTNIPLSSWNVNWDAVTIVRFEEGLRVGTLEQARSSRINVDSAASKRDAAAMALEIQRNLIGFFGFNNGNNRTYGFLNDPGLPAYVTAANGAAGSPLWSTKTYNEIIKDIRSMIVNLRTNSGGQIDPKKLDMTLALGTIDVDYLSVQTDFGETVQTWINKNYPKIRVVNAPELDGANGGANVAYLFADRVNDSSTDDGRTFMQNVPTKFMALGVQQLVKGYEEGYTNATAGVRCKRPYAVYRLSGI